MSANVRWNLSEWRGDLRARVTATKRATPVIVNQTMHAALLRAAELVPAASPAKIEQELRNNSTLFKVLQSPTTYARLPRRVQGMIARGAKNTRAQINAAASALLAVRRLSTGYIRAGFIKMARAYGATPRQRVSAKGLAGKSWGKRATVSSPVAVAANLARGADKVGAAALERALGEAGPSMIARAEKLLAKAWRK